MIHLLRNVNISRTLKQVAKGLRAKMCGKTHEILRLLFLSLSERRVSSQLNYVPIKDILEAYF